MDSSVGPADNIGANRITVCLTGIKSEDTDIVANVLKDLPAVLGIQLIHPINTLPPECTHLIIAKSPLRKTEKLQAALARGIPILDVEPFLSLDRSSSFLRGSKSF